MIIESLLKILEPICTLGMVPQSPRSSVVLLGNRASRSNILGGALKESSLKLSEPCWSIQDVAPQDL